MPSPTNARAFKTGWFVKAARKADISDAELCRAFLQAAAGQVEDLGGGVFKKRLNDNMHRSIILAKAGRFWVYAYLFAKKDRANIAADELKAFRKLAVAYAQMTAKELEFQLRNGDLVEICNGD